MTAENDPAMRRLVAELVSRAPAPHDWSRVETTTVSSAASRRPMLLVAAAAVAVAAGGVVTLAVVSSRDAGAPGAPGPPVTAGPASVPSTAPTSTTTTTTATTLPPIDPDWPGQLDQDLDTGVVTAPGFNDFIDEVKPSWAASAEATARAMVPEPQEAEQLQVVVRIDDQGRAVATATATNLMDDSAEAVRHRLVLSEGADGLHRFVEGSYAWRCQPGRGHQRFSVEPCT